MREVRARAPGRVNLMGEHTDYHDGFVLPCPLPHHTEATLRPRPEPRVTATSASMVARTMEFALGHEDRTGLWADYVQGLTWALRQEGIHVGGFELLLRSTVPIGSGLSSSAALEIATLRALRAAFDLPLSDVDLARIARRAEVEFVGAPVGIMDQMACSVGRPGHALLLDTRSLAFEHVPLPARLELAILDSGLTHHHATGDYRTRRRESEEAARLLQVTKLRDVSLHELERTATLPPLLARRARHVITENERVGRLRTALLMADLATVGRLFAESHQSMRDEYEISLPAIDLLVELAAAHPDVFGARLTGGGFGGAIVVAAIAGRAASAAREVRDQYAHMSGHAAAVLLPL